MTELQCPSLIQADMIHGMNGRHFCRARNGESIQASDVFPLYMRLVSDNGTLRPLDIRLEPDNGIMRPLYIRLEPADNGIYEVCGRCSTNPGLLQPLIHHTYCAESWPGFIQTCLCADMTFPLAALHTQFILLIFISIVLFMAL